MRSITQFTSHKYSKPKKKGKKLTNEKKTKKLKMNKTLNYNKSKEEIIIQNEVIVTKEPIEYSCSYEDNSLGPATPLIITAGTSE
jgi:hypothetical protein